MFWRGGNRRREIGRALTGLLGAALLLGGCSAGEGPPEPPPEEAATEAVPAAQAEADSQPPGSPRVASAEIVFRPSGTFPHGEHRRIECRTCHGTPPAHTSHSSVSCTSCHGTPPDYATLPVRSRDECMGCHHDPSRTGSCDACHSSAPQEALTIQASLQMSVWESPRDRTLSFEHPRHESLACRTCHQEAPSNAVSRGCGSCHDEHHRAEAACGSCHAPETVDHHDRSAHLGCGGAGCHQDPVVTALPATRPLCLVCHRGQTDHEAGRECVGCHLVSAPGGVERSPSGDGP